MSPPKNQPGLPKLFFGIAAEILRRIPNNHLVQRYAELNTRVAAKMLIREKEQFVSSLQALIKQRHGIRRCTNQPVMRPTKRLDCGCRIHVCDRHYPEIL